MSEEKKTDKATEILFKLSLKDDFKEDIIKIKKYVKSENFDEIKYRFWREQILEKNNLSVSPRLREVFDKQISLKTDSDKISWDFSFKLQTPSEEELKKIKRAFVKLWIIDGVSRDETIDYIKKNWKNIKLLHQTQNIPKVKRIRKIENKKEIKLIAKFSKFSIKELLKMAGAEGEKKQYREILISRLLEKEGFSMSPESIRVMINKYKL